MSGRVLLDTHALLWWTYQPHLLPDRVSETIGVSEEVFVSAVSAYEIALKYKKDQLPEAAPLVMDFENQIEQNAFRMLPVTSLHARSAGSLDLNHRDPWDRLLAAQAQLEQLTLISNDAGMRKLGIEPIW
jgi:PIN domain nuclease of toxin-antitoxin system